MCDINFRSKSYRLNGCFDGKENWRPVIKNKKKTGAEFPMEQELEDVFREALKDRIFRKNDYVFINPESGKPWTHRALDSMYRRVAKKAGYPKVTLEMFGRHSWVTQRLDEGWTYTDISKWTLNTEAVLQKYYANVTKATRAAVIALREKIGG